jgi:hypothetical protein
LQLQEAALNKDMKLADLLRLALVVARKLDIADFEKWLSFELEGYKKREDVPEYRILHGICRAYSQHHGWQDIRFKDSKVAEAYSTRPVLDPAAVLEEHVIRCNGTSSNPVMQYPAEVHNDILRQAGVGWSDPGIHFSTAQFAGILDAVRNSVLDWSLKLEKASVLGEGMTFSNDERQRAQTAAVPPTYAATHMTVIHSMTQSQVQQASPGANRTFTVQTVNVKELLEFVTAVRALEVQVPEKEKAQLKADLSTLEARAAAPTPSPGIVAEAAASVRKILESAGGALTAANLPALLQKAATIFS